MKILNFLSSLAAFFTQKNEVIAFFQDPADGLSQPYKEAAYLNPKEMGSFSDTTLGKQVLAHVGGGKAQILAFNTDGQAKTPNTHWFAPPLSWLKVVIPDIDYANSDLVYGNNETIVPTFNTAKIIPFKKVGNAIKYDASVGGSTTPTTVAGLSTTNVPAPAPQTPGSNTPGSNTPGGNTLAPGRGNQKTGLAAIAWYMWVLIAAGFVLLYLLIRSLLKGGSGMKRNGYRKSRTVSN